AACGNVTPKNRRLQQGLRSTPLPHAESTPLFSLPPQGEVPSGEVRGGNGVHDAQPAAVEVGQSTSTPSPPTLPLKGRASTPGHLGRADACRKEATCGARKPHRCPPSPSRGGLQRRGMVGDGGRSANSP